MTKKVCLALCLARQEEETPSLCAGQMARDGHIYMVRVAFYFARLLLTGLELSPLTGSTTTLHGMEGSGLILPWC